MADKRVGLVIGNNYPKWDTEKQLKFAVADAEKVKEILENKDICGFDEVIYLKDETSNKVREEIEKIFKRSDINLVFIYFSGHGTKDYEDDLCLLLSDTKEETLLSTSLTFEFINKCRRYPSLKSVVIILDCCYSGSAKITDRDPSVMDILKKNSGLGTIILTSTGLKLWTSNPLIFGNYVSKIITKMLKLVSLTACLTENGLLSSMTISPIR